MYKFHLIIDGCNGPIRFREKHLRRAAAAEEESLSCVSEDDTVPTPESNLGIHDNDGVILSFLQPESITEGYQRNSKKNNKSKKKNGKQKKSDDSGGFEEPPNRLDMIPLLHKLVTKPPFDSVSVIFDGNSITKRPNNRVPTDDEIVDDNIVQGSLWDVHGNTKAARILRQRGNNNHPVTIEITGLYDEADNIIVDTVEDYHRLRSEVESERHPGFEEPPRNTTRIQVVRRTDRGAGKNRRLFQPLGLLRPDSVACLFESSCSDGEESTSYERLASDSTQILQTLRRNNPGNVFLELKEPFIVRHAADTDTDSATPTVPIVASDDVFLRQRAVQEGGYVMTFHQLWLLLMDTGQ
jgi:hypothetical protein